MKDTPAAGGRGQGRPVDRDDKKAGAGNGGDESAEARPDLEHEVVQAQERAAHAERRASHAEDHLRERTLLLGQFEHKMKTSLLLIAGWAVSLEERWERFSDNERKAALGTIRRQAEQAVAQVDALLDESRAELTSLDLDPQELDLAAVLSLSAELFDGSTTHHEVVYEGPDTLPVRTDPAALQQVLGQLIENAVKYSPGGGVIVLSAADGGDDVAITVRDLGVGIPEGIDVFAPFQRGDNVADTKGAGLGLYIVRNLIGAMGGNIHAERNPDRGSSFVIRLPR
jgi:signal transduction histidine kinase